MGEMPQVDLGPSLVSCLGLLFPAESCLESGRDSGVPSSSWSRKRPLGEPLLKLDENQDSPVQTWPLVLGQTKGAAPKLPGT